MIDVVSGWFVKASDYMLQNKSVRTAFVATNSICQGEQVNTLWGLLQNKGIHINFAYTSFPWNNDANGNAAVSCIIVGISYISTHEPKLFTYDHKRDNLVTHNCHCISPYLIDCKDPIIIERRSKAMSCPLNIVFGNKPVDDGHLIFSYEEYTDIIRAHPEAKPFIKKYVGSEEIMKSSLRYCLWTPNEEDFNVLNIIELKERAEKISKYRALSTKPGTVKCASTPWRFTEYATPSNPDTALLIPIVSSERRKYVPLAFIKKDTIASAQVHMLPNASYYDFGILMSLMHNVWIKLTSGRLGLSIRYSRDMTFNTFVWPEVSDEQRDEIDKLAKEILLTRIDFETQFTLGEMYNPENMPDELKDVHNRLDAAVERAYRDEPFKDDEERLSFLLDLYSKAIAAEENEQLKAAKPKKKKATAKAES